MDFAPGDLVCLKSGSFVMTVRSTGQEQGEDYVYCVWSEKVGTKQEIKREGFSPTVLEKVDNPDENKFSAQALGIATLEVVHRIFDRLVEHQIMTEDDVTALFAKAADKQSLLDRPANEEASELLAWIAKERARKFRSG